MRRAHRRAPGRPVDGRLVVTAFTVAHPARTHSLTLSNTVGGLWTTAPSSTSASGRPVRPRVDDQGGRDLRRRAAHRRALGHLPHLRRTRPRPRLPLQELNTFHTPPMAAVGASLPGDVVAHRPRRHRRSRLVITSTDDVQFPPHLVIDSAQRLANGLSSRSPARATRPTSSGPTSTTTR